MLESGLDFLVLKNIIYNYGFGDHKLIEQLIEQHLV
jgi:hypothetical protein